jgi:FMN reductase
MSQWVPTTILVGSPRAASRTRRIAVHIASVIRARLAAEAIDTGEPDVVDLAELGPALPARATRAGVGGDAVRQALDLTRRPGLLVVVSPTYKGSYPGLLKLFLDMLPIDGLGQGTVAVAAMTAAWPQHRIVVDLYLRALLVELGACVPARGFSILENEFTEIDTVFAGWALAAVPALAAQLHRADLRPIHPVHPGHDLADLREATR